MRVSVEVLGSPLIGFTVEKKQSETFAVECGECGEVTVVSNGAGEFELAQLPSDDDDDTVDDGDDESVIDCSCSVKPKNSAPMKTSRLGSRTKKKLPFGFTVV